MSELPSDFEILARYTRALSVALSYRDLYTKLHSERVQVLASSLGEACGMTQQELEVLQIAASFHDIGKLGIPDAILSKPGRLDETEYAVVKTHASIGEEILMATDLPGSREAASIVRHHHEYFSGNSYPDNLAGDQIPLASRIIGIADSYDAMAERRAYHAARPHREILAILEGESGEKHDPEVLNLFFRVIATAKICTD